MNNNKICMAIRCIIDCNDNPSEKLGNLLQQKIKEKWEHAHVLLRCEEKYWKYENSNEVIYGVAHDSVILVKEVMSLFNVTWFSIYNDSYNNKTVLFQEREEAIWNRNNYEAEMFLLPDVEWVSIYTWKE